MRIVYMGTPDFAVPALEALAKSEHEVVAVVTQPDKARDRGKKVQFTPVKTKALEYDIPVYQPEKVKTNEEFYQQLVDLAPDLIVVAAYGKILPVSILELPKYGCVNIHASLLPKYRGAAPIHRAIINGDKTTGVTLMYMAEGMDTGDMIAKAETEIGLKTVEMMHEELADLGAKLLMDTLPQLLSGTAPREPQNEEEATHAPMVFKQDGVLDYTRSADMLCCLVRGMNSWPVASTSYQGNVVKVWEAEALEKTSDKVPGTILSCDKTGLKVACGEGIINITKLQFPGKRAMEVADYIKGNTMETGVILGGN
ncbi:MAG: methionyl-tRNA formyltransferase [Firmicutes bacterium]|nr:methionyl-tRNA formyltransferase [Bacillota bacterium]